jgi:N-methylhydantoinase A
MLLVGIDVGGTFTDLVILDTETQGIEVNKVLSTPDDPTQGFMESLSQMNVDLSRVERIVHGTTIATNAVVERKGAKTAVLVTKGHKDVIQYGMIARYKPGGLWDVCWQRDAPYVPRALCLEITERMLYTGEIMTPLDEEDVLNAINVLEREQVEAVAVCLLNSYVNPSHEQKVGKLLKENLADSIAISLSSETVNEFREYERWATTILNAYVAPRLRAYLSKLSNSVHNGGYGGDIFYMVSSGGVVTESTAGDYPIRFILSGPAGGVSTGEYIGRQIGTRDVITYDMGGTSTDICLIKDLKLPMVTERIFESVPIKTPQLDVITIGAGGGSIAWVTSEGELRVGPHSAGALPGPVSYGKGGKEITITDANLLLGRLGIASMLSGRTKLDRDIAEKEMRSLAQKVKLPDIHQLADGIIKIAVNNMSGAIRTVSIERGHDPRDFTLIACGGMGPMHAIPLADEIHLSNVLIPNNPGHTCAFGMLVSDLKHDYVRTYITEIRKAELSRIRTLLNEMTEEGKRSLVAEGMTPDRIDILYSADLRYKGQSWQINTPISLDYQLSDIEQAFHEVYHSMYGYSREEMKVELVYLRVVASARVEKPNLAQDRKLHLPLTGALKDERQVYFNDRFVRTPVYERSLIASGSEIDGPAVIEELGSTTVVFPEWSTTVDDLGNLIMQRICSTK